MSTSEQPITAATIAAAAGITPDEVFRRFTDRHNVTYVGPPAELALAAIMRDDVTPSLPWEVHRLAEILAMWLTCPAIESDHAQRIGAMPAYRICELVAHLASTGDPHSFGNIGAKSLPHYTKYLIDFPDKTGPMPRMTDRSRYGVIGDNRPLRIAATAADGADTVLASVTLSVVEQLSWHHAVAVPVPVSRVHEFSTEPDTLADYLNETPGLWKPYFTRSDAQSEGKELCDPELDGPWTEMDNQEPESTSAEPLLGHQLTLMAFYVGADAREAATTTPFLDRVAASRHAAASGTKVWSLRMRAPAAAMTGA